MYIYTLIFAYIHMLYNSPGEGKNMGHNIIVRRKQNFMVSAECVCATALSISSAGIPKLSTLQGALEMAENC